MKLLSRYRSLHSKPVVLKLGTAVREAVSGGPQRGRGFLIIYCIELCLIGHRVENWTPADVMTFILFLLFT